MRISYSLSLLFMLPVALQSTPSYNAIQPVPADRDVEQQIESAANLLTTLIEAAEVEFVRRTNANESTAGALHLLLRIHAFDRAAKQLDDDMLEYARGERVTELISLGQEAVALEDEQRTLPEHFGTDELNASILCTLPTSSTETTCAS